MSKCSEKEIREIVIKMIKEKLCKIMKWAGITGTISTITLTTTLLIQTGEIVSTIGYILAMVFVFISVVGHVEGEYDE